MIELKEYQHSAVNELAKQLRGLLNSSGEKVNPTESSVGSGAKLLADFQVGGVSKASIDNAGKFNALSYSVNGTAGASGSFTTADAKTVTVTNGLITSIV